MINNMQEELSASQLKIFLSYSRRDQQIAGQIRQDLIAVGYDVWQDITHIRLDEANWEATIRKAIQSVEVLIYIGSPSAAESNIVNAELRTAEIAENRILCIFAIGNEWEQASPFRYSRRQYVDMRGEAYRIGIKQLINELQLNPARSLIPHAMTEESEEKNDASRFYDDHLFVGRTNLTKTFTSLVQRLRAKKIGSVFWMYGSTGSGKSWLLNHFRTQFDPHILRTALVDMYLPQEALDNVLRLFKLEIGGTFAHFMLSLDELKRIRMDRSADQQSIKVAKIELIRAFAKDISLLPAPVVLIIDTFEKAARAVESGIYTYLIDEVLQGNLPVVLIISGWNKPRSGYQNHDRLLVSPVPGFSEDDVRQYLRNTVSYVPNHSTAQKIMQLTVSNSRNHNQRIVESNPLELMMFTDLLTGKKGDLPVTDELIDQTITSLEKYQASPILELWVSHLLAKIAVEKIPLIEASAIPLQFTDDILKVIAHLSDDDTAMQYIKRLLETYCDFNSDGSIQYHEGVRRALHIYMWDNNRKRYLDLHSQCATYYQQRITSEWSAPEVVSAFYHWLRVDVDRAGRLIQDYTQSNVPSDIKRVTLGQLLRKAISQVEMTRLEWADLPFDSIDVAKIHIPLLLKLGQLYQEEDNAVDARLCFVHVAELISNQGLNLPDILIQCYLGEAQSERWNNGVETLRALEKADVLNQRNRQSNKEAIGITIAIRRADNFRLRGSYPLGLDFATKAYIAAPQEYESTHMLGRLSILTGRVFEGYSLYRTLWREKAEQLQPKQHAYLATHLAEGCFFAGTRPQDGIFRQGIKWGEQALAEMETHGGEAFWPMYFGISKWNLARNLEGYYYGNYRLIDNVDDLDRLQMVKRTFYESVEPQVKTQYGFGEGWLRIDLARFLARTRDWDEAVNQTYLAIGRLFMLKSWHKLTQGLHNLIYIAHWRKRKQNMPLIQLATRIASGERNARLQREIIHHLWDSGRRIRARRNQAIQHFDAFVQPIDDEMDCIYFDVLARLEILRLDALSVDAKMALPILQRIFSLAICHSPNELERCLWEVLPNLQRVAHKSTDIYAEVIKFWNTQGPDTQQWQQVVAIWTQLAQQTPPSSYAAMEAMMRESEARFLTGELESLVHPIDLTTQLQTLAKKASE